MAQFDKAELEKLSKDEVKEEADRLGLPTTGTKAVLVQRLLDFDARDTNDDDDELDDDDALEPDAEADDEVDDTAPADEEDEELDDDEVPAADQKAIDAQDIKAVASRPEPDDEEDEDDDLELDDEEVDTPVETPKKRTRKPKAEKPDAPTGDTTPAKVIASDLGVEAKTLRQFFRSDSSTVEAVGAGGRYEFTAKQVETIKREFEGWRKEHAARGQRRTSEGTKKSRAKKPEVTEVEDAKELDIDDELDDEVDDEELTLDDDEED